MAVLNNSTTALNGSILPVERHNEQLIESFLAVYIMPVIIVLGTVGNLTSLAVLMRRRMRRTSVYLYLTVLAIADVSVLYVSAFKTWIRLMTGFELMHVSNMACSLVTFLLNVVLNVAAWLIVLTTVDRFVAVWLPLHAAAVCRRRRARLAALALVVVAVVASMHLTWTTGLHQSAGRSQPFCGPSPDAHFMRHHFEYIKLASYSLAPFVIILTLNVAIVVRLRCGKAANVLLRGNSGHGGGGGGGGGGTLQAAMTSRVTYMLLAVSATWLVLSAPFTLQTLIGGLLVDITDARSVARYRLFRTICFQLMYTNHAVNFFLYCVTGRKFRRELRDMYVELCCRCRGGGDRCGCGGGCVRGGDGATRDCGHKRQRDATPEPTTRQGGLGQELMIVTSCRSTRGSSLPVQTSPAIQRADSSL